MDIRATYRRGRRFGRRGWAWVCYSHPSPIERFYPDWPLGKMLCRWMRWPVTSNEFRCRTHLHLHLRVEHHDALEES